MNMKIKALLIGSLLILSIFLQASPATSQGGNEVLDQEEISGTFLDGFSEDCQPPCWNGLTPGASSEAEVIATLSDLSLELDPRLMENRLQPYNVWRISEMPPAGNSIYLIDTYALDNTLQGFEFHWDNTLVREVDPKSVLATLGEPEQVYYAVTGNGWPSLGIYFWFLYPEKNIYVIYQDEISKPTIFDTVFYCFDVDVWLEDGFVPTHAEIFMGAPGQEDLMELMLEYTYEDFEYTISENETISYVNKTRYASRDSIHKLYTLIMEAETPCILFPFD
jgi:hypothetical protein